MPQCLKCGAELTVNEEGVAPVLCDSCAGVATKRARRSLGAVGTLRQFPVTAALLAINVAVYAAMVVAGGTIGGFSGKELIAWGGNYGPWTIGGDYWRLVTANFVHANFLHIAFNMWALWSLGRLSERLFGRWQTAVIYLLTGIGGSLLSISYEQMRLSVGASGAIFGLGGAVLAGVRFGNLAISTGERRAIFSSLVFFIGLSFMMGMGSFGLGGGNVDNMCHLGGFVSGLIIGLPLATSVGSSRSKTALFQVITLAITAALLVAGVSELVKTKGTSISPLQRAFTTGDYPAAIKILEPVVATHPDNTGALLTLAETYVLNHEPGKAIVTAQRVLNLEPDSPDAYALLGDAYSLDQERDKAIAAYEQALKLNPNLTEAQQALQRLRGNNPSKE
ncbi:MAG TPA: rhomboid family intramembrane serine protease [Verrucomicrobiae bacterium]|jgi:rhomboid protease GluP|nr:rhomboid family intramembrane serine protease [Verrucomicrobiae bacterium]